jgi:O-antigen biosynthesis protein
VSVNGPAVSVVIPTCGRAAALERLLTSIVAMDYAPLEVVVVENRPPALGTRTVVEQRFASDGVRYVEEPRASASRARNTGLAQAEGEIIAFTDDDVVVDKNWVRTALAAFERTSGVGCVTGRILPLSLETAGHRLFDEFTVFDKGEEPREFRLPETQVVEPLFPYVAGHVGSGANIFVRREIALGIGGFDPVLGTPTLGGEDLDLFIRLVRDGITIAYDPDVIVFHDHPASIEQLRRHAYRYGMGLTAMLTKHLVHGPDRLELLRAIPRGVVYLLNPVSRKNVQKSSDFPRTLELLEYVGMLIGPVAYAVSLAEQTARDSPWLTGLRRALRRRVRADQSG